MFNFDIRFFQSGYLYTLHNYREQIKVECLGIGLGLEEPPMFDTIQECVSWCQNTNQTELVDGNGVFSLYFHQLDEDTHAPNEDKLIMTTAKWNSDTRNFQLEDYCDVTVLKLGILSQAIREVTLKGVKVYK